MSNSDAMNPTMPTAVRAAARGTWSVALCIALAGCATGPSNVQVLLPAYVVPSVAATLRGTVQVEPVREARREAVGRQVGQRTGLGGMSMGQIELEPSPTAAVTAMLQAELKAKGLALSDAGAPARVVARITRFQVQTPATALYWDILGAIDLEIDATGPGGRQHAASYQVQCTDRTYAWPTEQLIAKVLDGCLKDLGSRIRADSVLAGTLASP